MLYAIAYRVPIMRWRLGISSETLPFFFSSPRLRQRHASIFDFYFIYWRYDLLGARDERQKYFKESIHCLPRRCHLPRCPAATQAASPKRAMLSSASIIDDDAASRLLPLSGDRGDAR